jgi:hypothetical protein
MDKETGERQRDRRETKRQERDKETGERMCKRERGQVRAPVCVDHSFVVFGVP